MKTKPGVVPASRTAQPSSPFPFSPLTSDEASKRSADATRGLALWVLFPLRDDEMQRRCLASARQEAADHLRSTDVRCGYQREAWAA